MRKVAVIALILIVLLVGLPLSMDMSDMAPCPSCRGSDAPVAVAMCLAILLFFVLLVSAHSSRVASRRQMVRFLLLADPPERPPRVT